MTSRVGILAANPLPHAKGGNLVDRMFSSSVCVQQVPGSVCGPSRCL